jgi:hypothetical protein
MILELLFLMAAVEPAKLEHELDETARVASVMVDGDVCQRIVTPRAMAVMLHNTSPDPWADGDNYEVHQDSFIRTKKTLMRLAELSGSPVDINLWMPVKSDPPRIHIVIRNRNEMSQFWEWGKLQQELFPEMRTVLDTGKRTTVKRKPGMISVLAPVRNSLGDIVGLVEVVARLQPDARENVK